MLRLEQLTIHYGGTTAVAGVDLEVGDGEILCVLGPSGSGKSSLLRAIAGLVPDMDGEVAYDGVDLSRVPAHRRGFGLMFQDHALFPHRDVIGNVAFGLRMQGMSRTDYERRASDALALVGLAGFERRRVSEISGGEQQRVALARALAPEPRLLMLDEPLGALDRALRDRLVVELRALFVQLDLAVLFVTHDHDEAFAIADRIAVMHGGRIEQVGTPSEVWRRPANAFVASFLGWNVTDAFGEGRLAVRPEGLRLVPWPAAFGGVVLGHTFHRDHYVVEVETEDETVLKVAVGVDGALPEVGSTVGVEADPELVLRVG